MSDLLGIGASAVNAYRSALAIVGDNVANAETAGYARRSVFLKQNAGGAASTGLYTSRVAGSGVATAGVVRAWDDFKAADARLSASDSGRADIRSTWLGAVEDALPSGDDSLTAKVTAFFTAGTALAADPGSVTARAQMLNALKGAVSAINNSAAQLTQNAARIADAAGAATTSVNQNLAALAKINAALQGAGTNTQAQASLMDQRDQLLDDLAGTIGIDTSFDAKGAVTVTLSGSSDTTLLAGSQAAQIGVAQAADGRLALTTIGDDAHAIATTGGALAGLVDAAAVNAGARASLDAIANDFATQVNDWNANGTTASGAAGGQLLATGGGAAGLAVLTEDPAAIAAAGADGSENGNLLALDGLRGDQGAETRLANLTGINATVHASAIAEASAAASRYDTAQAARDNVGGVDLDREAAELIRYQQAYDGSAKIIQAAQTTLQSILSLF